MVTGCPKCKLFSFELVDSKFIMMGEFLRKYKCSECFYEEVRYCVD